MNKHKIVFLITSLAMGGAERHVLLLAKEISQTNTFTPVIITMAKKGAFYDQAIEAGIKVITIKRLFRYDLTIIFRLLLILIKEKPTILHSHMYFSNVIGRFTGRLAGVPIIISTEHGISLWKNKPIILFDRFTQFLTDQVITVSDISRKIRLRREKISPKRIIKINNFININDFHINEEDTSKLSKQVGLVDTFNIGIMTRLTKNKRVIDAIKAVQLVKESIPNVRLIILGEGLEKQNLIRFAAELDMVENILFVGYQSQIQLWLNIFDIFLLISEMEDFPLSLLEAMACAKPVIATKVGGVPEIVKNNETGLLIEPKNPEILAEKIIWLKDNPKIMEKIGQMGRERVEKYFSVQSIVPKILELYLTLLKEKGLM